MRGVSLVLVMLASCGPRQLIMVPQEAKGDVAVWFINDSKHDVCDIRMASAASADLGYDWLSTAETFFPDGESRGVKVRAGAYKILVKSCDEKFPAASSIVIA